MINNVDLSVAIFLTITMFICVFGSRYFFVIFDWTISCV